MRASVSYTQEPMKPGSCPSSEQGLASAVNLSGPLITSSPRHPWLSTPLFSGSLVAEVSSLCISSACLITLEFPTTKPRDSELQETTKEVVGIPRLQPVIVLCTNDLRKMILHVGPTRNSQHSVSGCNFSLFRMLGLC